MIAEGSKSDVINIKDEETYSIIKAISDEKQKIEDENDGII